MIMCHWHTYEGPSNKMVRVKHEGVLVNVFEQKNGDRMAAVIRKNETWGWAGPTEIEYVDPDLLTIDLEDKFTDG